ncbi:MAG: 23S rRNA (pseudouridine(1915)-N(3))-methyltransferase RlmH [Candidatus Zixiibacteriota bacterium]
MNIQIISVGKPRSDFQSFIGEFEKRISHFIGFQYRFIKASKLDGKQALDEEADKVLSIVDEKCDIIVMTRKAKSLSSLELAKLLNRKMQLSRDIIFIIGSADGISDKLKKRADRKISLSKMTLQHDIALILLFEQIYRALSIINNHPYHRKS